MINNIAQKFEVNDEEDGFSYEGIYNEMQGLSNEILIEDAQDFKYANLATKLRAVLLPEFSLTSKEIARDILAERGIDYKFKEREYQIKKEKTKQEWRGLWNFIKEINPFNTLYELSAKNNYYK